MSEHHNHGTIVGTAPEILIAAIAATTRRIRVGSAGVMLPHYSAVQGGRAVPRARRASRPGRIDLGLGRAPGSDGRTAFALNPLANERPAQFPSRRARPDGLGDGRGAARGPSVRCRARLSAGETAPEIWMLGSSDYGAQVAAHFGLPYAFAWFFTDGAGGAQALDLYRQLYKPSARHPEPHTALCVWALAAETEEEAQFHFSSRARFRLLRDRGIFSPLEPPDAALAHPYTEREQARIAELRKKRFVGTGPQVAERIEELAARLDVQEMAVVTWAYDEAARRQELSSCWRGRRTWRRGRAWPEAGGNDHAVVILAASKSIDTACGPMRRSAHVPPEICCRRAAGFAQCRAGTGVRQLCR